MRTFAPVALDAVDQDELVAAGAGAQRQDVLVLGRVVPGFGVGSGGELQDHDPLIGHLALEGGNRPAADDEATLVRLDDWCDLAAVFVELLLIVDVLEDDAVSLHSGASDRLVSVASKLSRAVGVQRRRTRSRTGAANFGSQHRSNCCAITIASI